MDKKLEEQMEKLIETKVTLPLEQFERMQWQYLSVSLARTVNCENCKKEIRNNLWIRSANKNTIFVCDACLEKLFKKEFN